MKKLFFIFVIIFIVKNYLLSEVGYLVILIKGLRNNRGVIRVVLYDKKEHFPDQHQFALKKTVGKVVNEPMKFILKDISYGKYAITVLHDENNNSKMDYTWYGIPKEGFGFSNNPKVKLSKPQFNEAMFELNSSTKEVAIELIYMTK